MYLRMMTRRQAIGRVHTLHLKYMYIHHPPKPHSITASHRTKLVLLRHRYTVTLLSPPYQYLPVPTPSHTSSPTPHDTTYLVLHTRSVVPNQKAARHPSPSPSPQEHKAYLRTELSELHFCTHTCGICKAEFELRRRELSLPFMQDDQGTL